MSSNATDIRLLALDVDGTVSELDNLVRPEVVDALEALAGRGVCVCLATGRNYTETMPIWRQLRLGANPGPLITNGGAIVSEAGTRRTLYQKPLQHAVVTELADALHQRGRTVVANIDRWRWQQDILALPGDDFAFTKSRWFDRMPDLRIRTVEAFGDGIHEPDVLRINAVLTREEGEAVVAELEELFAGRLTLHAILAPNYGVYFLEAFDPGASKWSALNYIAQGLALGPGGHRRGRRRHQRPADDPSRRAGHRHAVGPAHGSRRRRPHRRARPRDRSPITPLIPTKQR